MPVERWQGVTCETTNICYFTKTAVVIIIVIHDMLIVSFAFFFTFADGTQSKVCMAVWLVLKQYIYVVVEPEKSGTTSVYVYLNGNTSPLIQLPTLCRLSVV